MAADSSHAVGAGAFQWHRRDALLSLRAALVGALLKAKAFAQVIEPELRSITCWPDSGGPEASKLDADRFVAPAMVALAVLQSAALCSPVGLLAGPSRFHYAVSSAEAHGRRLAPGAGAEAGSVAADILDGSWSGAIKLSA